MDIFEYTIPANTKGIRLSDIPVNKLLIVNSKSDLKKRIKKGLVYVNGKEGLTGTMISAGDEIEIFPDLNIRNKLYQLKIPIYYEDDNLAVVEKPAGLTTSGNKHRTLENTLPFNLKSSILEDALPWMRPVHRLDAATSGLVIIAKTRIAMKRLFNQIEEKKIVKKYIAIVAGDIESKGTFNRPIESKNAITHFELLKKIESQKYGDLSFVKISIETGRTHQIRKHFSFSDHPIIGDKLYNDTLSKNVRGLYLHAYMVRFHHPIKEKDIILSTPLPKKFTLFKLKDHDLNY